MPKRIEEIKIRFANARMAIDALPIDADVKEQLKKIMTSHLRTIISYAENTEEKQN
jgi:hypothetical protein